MNKIYAGIGSRETPTEILAIFEHLGCWLANKGYTLRSGHADGADMAFENGFDKSKADHSLKEIYLPWAFFNNSTSLHSTISPEAVEIARKFHPRYDTLSQGAQKLQARNSYQVLGYDLKTPVDFIICWTPNGSGSGGTGQAIRIAKAYNIPVFDFGHWQNIETAKTMFNAFIKNKLEVK